MSDEAYAEYTDQILVLDNKTTLIARTITSVDGELPESDNLILYKPCEIVTTSQGDIWMRDWVSESDDDFIIIPSDRVMTIATPKDSYLKNYHAYIKVSKESYAPTSETIQ